MYLLIIFINLLNIIESYYTHNGIIRRKLVAGPLYEQPRWNLLEKSLKSKARNWFLNRAEKRGIRWNETYNYYLKNSNALLFWKVNVSNMSLEYPSYYIKPFHGYDQGNMNWNAAYEGEAATLSMSANYWKDVNPSLSEKWVRFNITSKTDSYRNKNICQNEVGFDERYLSFFDKSKPIITDKILDIGCSFGIGTEFLKKSYPNALITGIDLSPYFLAIASFRNNITNGDIKYIHANAENMPFEVNTYDQVFIQYLFHEMPSRIIENVINEAYRILKPGGVISIVDLNPTNLNENLSINIFRKWAFEVTEPHIFDYYKTNITQLMSNINFRNIEKTPNDPINIIYFGQK